MQYWVRDYDPAKFIDKDVRALKKIYQPPTSTDRDVPRGTKGFIEDYVDGLWWVDFGDEHGVVAANWDEITLI